MGWDGAHHNWHQVVNELLGSDGGVEQAIMPGVTVPNFVDGFMDEFYGCLFSGFVGSTIVDENGMDSFVACAVHGRGTVSDGRVC